MIEVELPNGTIAEFPDGTAPGVIEKALQQHSVNDAAKSRVGEMPTLRKIGYGAERSLDEAAMGLKQIFPKALGGGLSEQERRELAIRREMENQIPGTSIGRIAGDMAIYGGPLAKLARGVGAALPAIPRAAGYLTAAIGGGGVGALQPTLEGESRTTNAAQGAAFGMGGQAVGQAVGGAIRGLVPKSEAARSLPQSVQDAATLGQVADRTTPTGRVISGVEERLKSVPVLGSVIENARDRGTDAWRQSIMARATPPGAAPTTGGPLREQLAETYGGFRNAYAKALAGRSLPPSQMFEQQVLKATTNPQSGVPQDIAERIRQDVMRNYQSRFQANPGSRAPAGTGLTTPGNPGVPVSMRAEEAKGLEGYLSGMANRYSKSQGPMDPNIGNMYADIDRAWSTVYRRQLGPQARQALRPIDNAYGPYKTVERAAAAVGNEGGNFTPAQLVNSVSSRTGKARFGRGEGFLADEAQAGKTVFMDRLPNSGTADRMMLAGAAGGLIVDPVTTLGTGAAVGAALPLFTTTGGKNLMTGDTRMQRILQALRADQAARRLGAPGGVAAREALTNDSTEY